MIKKYYNTLNRKNWEAIGSSCAFCGLSGDGLVTVHHIYTRKAWPEHKESKFNCMPVCAIHHNEIHSKGDLAIFRDHYRVRFWMLDNGWYEESGKLLNKNTDKSS